MAPKTTPSKKRSVACTSGTKDNGEFKEKFDVQLSKFYKDQTGSVKKPCTGARVAEVLRPVQAARAAAAGARRTTMQYYWSNKYYVARVGSGDCLVLKKKTLDDPTVQVVPTEQYFELLFKIHKKIGHGGRDKMMHNIKNRFYVQKKAIEIFVSSCLTCEEKRNLSKRGILPASPHPVQKDFNTLVQVDLIDLQFSPDGVFSWLLLYQDHGTKFIQLRPLQTNQPNEVALELLKIFLTFGAPITLQSNHGHQFIAKVIEEVTKLWPDSKIFHGKDAQTLESSDCSNKDVRNMLHRWMQHNRSTNWSTGCHFVQYQKNDTFHPSIGKTPYQGVFRRHPSVLQSSHINDNNYVKTEVPDMDVTNLNGIDKSNVLDVRNWPLNTTDDKTGLDNDMEMDSLTSSSVCIKEETEWSEAWSEPEPGAATEPESGAATEPESGAATPAVVAQTVFGEHSLLEQSGVQPEPRARPLRAEVTLAPLGAAP